CSYCFFFSSRRRHTRFSRDWSSDVCSSDLENDLQYDFNTDRTYTYSVGKNAEDCETSGTIKGTWKFGGSTLGMITSCLESVVDLESEERRVGKECRALGSDAHGQ